MEDVRPWCNQPSDRGRLNKRTEQIIYEVLALGDKLPHNGRGRCHVTLSHLQGHPYCKPGKCVFFAQLCSSLRGFN